MAILELLFIVRIPLSPLTVAAVKAFVEIETLEPRYLRPFNFL